MRLIVTDPFLIIAGAIWVSIPSLVSNYRIDNKPIMFSMIIGNQILRPFISYRNF